MNISTEMIKTALNDLQEFKDQLELLNQEMDDKIQQLIPQDVFTKITHIKMIYGEKIKEKEHVIKKNESAIKELIVSHGNSFKGNTLHAVYTDGRISWDSKGLDGYMVAHPEIEAFRKVGNPSVSIRKAK